MSELINIAIDIKEKQYAFDPQPGSIANILLFLNLIALM